MELLNVDKMAEKFDTVEEMKAYSQAQYQTILDLSKKLKRSEAELEILREKLERLGNENATKEALNKENGIFDISDEETICLTQLALIRSLAMARELTTEEAKKFEIYHKVLNGIRNRKPVEKPDLGELSTEELVKLIDKTMES